MPSPHCDLAVLSRSGGHSAVGRLAYIERGGPYASRIEEVIALGSAGPSLGDWSCVDRAERRKDAAVLYELTLPIPWMLPVHEQRFVMQAQADFLWREHALPSRWAIHDRGKWDERNRNGHIIAPMRTATEDGKLSDRKAKTLQRKHGGRAAVVAIRAYWQDLCNEALARAGRPERVDLRTLAAQGIDRPAQVRIPRHIYERARRGQIHSPVYERNQSIARLKATQEARADATTATKRARRAAAVGVVIRGCARRAARRPTRGRNVDQAHPRARHPGGGPARDRRDGEIHPDREERSLGGRGVRVADQGSADQRQAGPVPSVDTGGIAGRDRSRNTRTPDAAHLEIARLDTGEEQIREQTTDRVTPPQPPVQSLITRAARWLTGAERREAKAKAQAESEAQQHAYYEQKRREQEAESARRAQTHLDAQARAEHLRIEEAAARVLAVEESDHPLVSIHTATGGWFYARRQDWLTAREKGEVNLPLCTFLGEPIEASTGRTTLRMSTVEMSVINPAAILSASEYLAAEDTLTPRRGVKM